MNIKKKRAQPADPADPSIRLRQSGQRLRRQAEAKLGKHRKKTAPAPALEADSLRLVHELQVHQIELEMQNEELGQARAELETLLRQYTDLYDFAPVGYLTLARDGTIRSANLAGANLLGMEHSTLIKRRFGLFVSVESRPAFNAFLENLLSADGKKTCELALLKNEDALFWVRLEATGFESGQECRAALVDITERRRAEEALRVSEQKFRLLAENAPDLIYRYRLAPTRGFEYVSPAATRITGYTPEDHYADPDLGFKLVHPDDQYLLENAAQGEIRPDEPINLRWVRRDGTMIWTEQRNIPIFDDAGNLIALEGIARDITARKQAEELLRESEERYRDLVEVSPSAILVQSDGRLVFVNPAAIKLLGAAHSGQLIGKSLWEIIHPDHHQIVRNNIQKLAEGQRIPPQERKFIRLDGSAVDVEVFATQLVYQNLPAVQVIAQDITERKHVEESLRAAHSQLQAQLAEIEELQIELREQAIRDPLTGLYNRRYLFEALALEVPRAIRAGYPISIIMLDIDRFKIINDSFGHDAGDKTLQVLAAQLKALARAEDVVCRYGGDEHLIVMHNTTADKAVERAEQLRKAIARTRVTHAGKSFKFTGSFGVAVFPVHAAAIDEVISIADHALYESKRMGGDRVMLL